MVSVLNSAAPGFLGFYDDLPPSLRRVRAPVSSAATGDAAVGQAAWHGPVSRPGVCPRVAVPVLLSSGSLTDDSGCVL